MIYSLEIKIVTKQLLHSKNNEFQSLRKQHYVQVFLFRFPANVWLYTLILELSTKKADIKVPLTADFKI